MVNSSNGTRQRIKFLSGLFFSLLACLPAVHGATPDGPPTFGSPDRTWAVSGIAALKLIVRIAIQWDVI
jgi:hypothetical protein